MAGNVWLRDVEFIVLPGAAKVLIGKREMVALGLTLPRDQLREKILQVSVSATVPPDEHSMEDSADDKELDPFSLSGPKESVASEVSTALDQLVEHTRTTGASTLFVEGVQSLIRRYKGIWRLHLGSDPPAAVRPMAVSLVADSGLRVSGGVRRYSETQRQFMHDEVAELVERGLAVRVSSPAAVSSPVVLARKQDGTWRMCVDLRQVNSVTKPLPFPIPRFEEIVQHLRSAKFFASFDMLKGYWQFPLDPDSRKYFTFSTHEGLYEPTRVPMGAKNAVRHFQSVMMEILEPLLYRRVLVYLDDLLVHGETEAQLLEAIEQVFACLDAVGIKLHPKKCVMWSKEVEWCGHVISGTGVKIQPQRIDALCQLPAPSTAAELQQFLAAVNWTRLHLPEFAKVAAPLQDLLNGALHGSSRTKKTAGKIPLRWTTEHDGAFADVKKLLTSAVELAHPNPDFDFCLFTDASETHWGAMLTQVPPGLRFEKPIAQLPHLPLAVLSGAFKGAALRWSTIDKEAFAIKEACLRLDYLLQRTRGFTIYTDHKNLRYIFDQHGLASQSKSLAARLERWSLLLRAFTFDIEHIAGDANVWADLLSRWGSVKSCDVSVNVFVKEDVLGAMDNSLFPTLEEIRQAQSTAKVPTGATRNQDGLECVNGGVWVPEEKDLRIRICVVGHAGGGHRGLGTTQSAIEKLFWWETLSEDVASFVGNCIYCVKLKDRSLIPRPLGTQIRAAKRNEVLHFDFLKMPLSEPEGLQYVLVLKDDFSQFVELVPCVSATASVTAMSLLWWFARFGVVATWISDQGSHFKNTLLTELKDIMKADHHFTVAYSPWANGTIERCNREFLRVMRVILAQHKMSPTIWPALLPSVQSVLNHSSSPRLGGLSPVEVMIGLPPSLPLHAVLTSPTLEKGEGVVDLTASVKEMKGILDEFHVISKVAREGRNNSKTNSSRTHANFEIGDFVLVAAVQPDKLSALWQGPSRVVSTRSDWVYVVESLVSGKKRDVHATRLQLYSDASLNVTTSLKRVAEYDETPLVSALVDHRRDATGKSFEFRVRWLGFEEAEDTWEPARNLAEDTPALVEAYVKASADPTLKKCFELGL